MADFRRKSLPVTDDGRVVGMISRADVVRQLARHDRQIAAEIHHRAREDSYDWMIEVDNGVVTFGGVDSESDRHDARLLAGAVEGVRGIQFRH
jgi:CBS domain-containing protein